MVVELFAALAQNQSALSSMPADRPQAAELSMPQWFETTQSAGCVDGVSSITLRFSSEGSVVTRVESPGAAAAALLPKLNAYLAPVRYVAKIRVHCAVKAAMFEVEGYDAWKGPGAKPISRRFAIGGNNFTPLP